MSYTQAMFEYEFSAATDIGLTRDNNEDSIAFDPAVRLVVVADGMGGYNAGEVASSMATNFILAEMSRWLSQAGLSASVRHIARALQICVTNANLQIQQAASANPEFTGMGTTLILGVFVRGKLVLGHIGDSRCYLFRDGKLSQLSKDHSLLQEHIDAGLISPANAHLSLHKNFVTRALGVDADVVLETHAFSVQHDDIFIFCTDGLSDMVDTESMGAVLRTTQDTDQLADTLIRLANTNGGVDNISVLLAKAKATAGKTGFFSRFFRQ
jgi:serine/threonine protein phosphatase PrpC